MVGSDCKRQDFLLAAVVHANLAGKRVDQPRIPLVQQVNRGRDHDGRAVHPVDSLYCDKGLARSCRKHDAAALSGHIPGRESRHLVIMRFPRLLYLQVERLPARNGVANILLLQVWLDRAVVVAFAAPALSDQLEWCGRSLLRVYLAQDKRATLVIDGLAHEYMITEFCFKSQSPRIPVLLSPEEPRCGIDFCAQAERVESARHRREDLSNLSRIRDVGDQPFAECCFLDLTWGMA